MSAQRFGSRVRKLRRAREWSIQELARRADKDPTYLGQVERGLRNPTLSVMEQLAEALGTPLWRLLNPDDPSAGAI